jgi:cytochrome c-type biogenesis protein CcmH
VGIEVEVSLAPELAAQVAPEDTLFVFARAAQGSPMPLAVQRRQVKDLPLKLRLDDSMALQPQLRLSAFPQVLVGARISKAGSATPQSGDLQGEVAPVASGQPGTVKVKIDTVRP